MKEHERSRKSPEDLSNKRGTEANQSRMEVGLDVERPPRPLTIRVCRVVERLVPMSEGNVAASVDEDRVSLQDWSSMTKRVPFSRSKVEALFSGMFSEIVCNGLRASLSFERRLARGEIGEEESIVERVEREAGLEGDDEADIEAVRLRAVLALSCERVVDLAEGGDEVSTEVDRLRTGVDLGCVLARAVT